MTQKLTDAMFTGTLASTKLTGAMGNNDGSALTGVGGDGATDSANDPAINTNPSGGVGTLWANHTSGELYVCTDATTDANVWYNVGGGSGDVQPWQFAATIAGYSHGGHTGSANSNAIEKFSIQTESNGTDVGDLTQSIRDPGGCSSGTHGYAAGGFSAPDSSRIEKYSFSSDGNSADTTADLTVGRSYCEGHSTEDYGYLAGGTGPHNNIDRFPFASSSNATDVGDLAVAMYGFAAASSETHGWAAGGSNSVVRNNNIQKYAFASSSNATDVANMSQINRYQGGFESSTHGYSLGGDAAGGGDIYNVIEKYAFASNGNGVNIGDLSLQQVYSNVGVASASNGYSLGGWAYNGSSWLSFAGIDKVSFASDGNATNIADLSSTGRYGSGPTQN